MYLALVAISSVSHLATCSSSSGSQLSSKSSEEGDDQIPLFSPSTSSTSSATLDPNEWSPDAPSTSVDPNKWAPDENESASGSTSVAEDSASGSANGSSEPLSRSSPSSASTTTSLRGSSSASLIREASGSASASECAGSTVWISVETMDGVFCLPSGAAVCSGNKAYGKCPEAQSGLPYGSYCAEIHPHVFGCRPWAKPVSSPNGVSAASLSSSTSTTSA